MARLILQRMNKPEAKKVLEEYAQQEREAKKEADSKDLEKAEKS